MKKGDKVKIKSGPFKGKTAILKRPIVSQQAWFVLVDGLTEMVWEDELALQNKSSRKAKNDAKGQVGKTS